MLELPPLSLYVHIPWCARKCPYCDFNSHAASGALPEQAYLDALLNDLSADLDYVQSRTLTSIFIGGGTPSLLSADFYRRLLDGISHRIPFERDLECTLEANPGASEAGRFKAYRQLGINRLSLGIQSFDDRALAALGRIHDGRESADAIGFCLDAGFDNFNLDIMYALPGQSSDSALDDLGRALAFNPPHLSWYQLTIEPNTEFYRRPPVLPNEDQMLTIMEAGMAMLGEAGLEQYETSAYARSGRQARHNLNYWQFGDYLGIGAGASGKITVPGSGRLIRTRKVRQPNHYLARTGSYIAETVDIESDSLNLEFMMNALRLTDGFTPGMYERRTGLSFSEVGKKLEYLESAGLLTSSPTRIAPTAKGRLFVNSLLEQFL